MTRAKLLPVPPSARRSRPLSTGIFSFVAAAAFIWNVNAATPYWDASPGLTAGWSWNSGPSVTKDGLLYTVASGFTGEPQNSWATLYRWSPCDGWAALGGLHAFPIKSSSMCLQGDDIYVAGDFDGITTTYGNLIPAHHVAKYHIPTGTWSAIGNDSLTDSPQAIAVDNNGLVYLGFRGLMYPGAGQCDPSMLKKWDASANAWVPVGPAGQEGLVISVLSGASQLMGVTALAVDGTDLYVGGDFDRACDGTVSYSLIKWDGTSWHTMVASPVRWGYQNEHNGYNLMPIVVSGNNVFVAGMFNGWIGYEGGGGILCKPMGIARFTTQGGYIETKALWNLYSDAGVVEGRGLSLAALNGTVYLAGFFDTLCELDGWGYPAAPYVTAYGVARWTDGTWSALGSGTELVGQGYPARGVSVAAGPNEVYSVGWFDTVGNVTGLHSGVARWVLNDTTCPSRTVTTTWSNATNSWSWSDLNIQGSSGIWPDTVINHNNYDSSCWTKVVSPSSLVYSDHTHSLSTVSVCVSCGSCTCWYQSYSATVSDFWESFTGTATPALPIVHSLSVGGQDSPTDLNVSYSGSYLSHWITYYPDGTSDAGNNNISPYTYYDTLYATRGNDNKSANSTHYDYNPPNGAPSGYSWTQNSYYHQFTSTLAYNATYSGPSGTYALLDWNCVPWSQPTINNALTPSSGGIELFNYPAAGGAVAPPPKQTSPLERITVEFVGTHTGSPP